MPAIDTLGSLSTGLDSVMDNLAVVTPSDSSELAYVTRGVHLGTGGDLKVMTKGGQMVTLPGLVAGWHPIRVRQIYANGTTASQITAGW